MSENHEQKAEPKAEKKAKKEIVFKSHVLHNGKEFNKGEVCPKELLEVIPEFCLEESK